MLVGNIFDTAGSQREEPVDADSAALNGTREAFLRLDDPTATPTPSTEDEEPDQEPAVPLDEPTPTDEEPPAVAAAPVNAAPVVQPAPVEAAETDSDDDGSIPEAPGDTPGIYDGWAGDLEATIDTPEYLAEGRWAEVFVTIKNISVEPGIATGYTYLQNNEGGGWRLVSLFRVNHYDVPQAKRDDAPLWIADVDLTNGDSWEFAVGCLYIEVLHAEGWEPIYDSDDGYSWTVHEEGGWFDCGNSHDKIPAVQFIAPGESATIPLYIYIQHPREWEDEPPPGGVRIRNIAISAQRWDDGANLGVVATWPN